MKVNIPDYIGCIAEYHNGDPDVTAMRSITIISKAGKTLVARYFDIMNGDYTDDEACMEIDAIAGDFHKPGKVFDIVYSQFPIPINKVSTGGYMIKMITVPEYIKIIKDNAKFKE